MSSGDGSDEADATAYPATQASTISGQAYVNGGGGYQYGYSYGYPYGYSQSYPYGYSYCYPYGYSYGGLANVTVTLVGAGNSALGSATTAADGAFSFGNLSAGSYTLDVTAPSGYLLDGDNESSWSVAVSTPGPNDVVDVGAYQPTTLAGTAFADDNGDGIQDNGEAGVANASVALEDQYGNAILNSSGDPIAATTDANGNYSFANLSPGWYTLAVLAPAGFATNGLSNSTTTSVAIDSGDGTDYANVPLYNATLPATIFGTVSFVNTENGNAAGLGNVTLSLEDSAGDVLDTAETDADGNYAFTGLSAGQYTVTFLAPTGYLLADSGCAVWSTTVDTPGLNNEVDETAYQYTTLDGTAFLDANGNGLLDAGEAGLANVSVALEDEIGDPILDSSGNAIAAIADSNGNYSFANVSPGYYTLDFTAPAGFAMDGPGNETWIGQEVNSGDGVDTVDAPVYLANQPVTIDGDAFVDGNDNGVQDEGEAGLGNVTVALLDSSGDPVLDDADEPIAATTDDNGNYSFGNLTPGNYTVQFTAPTGYVLEDSGNATFSTSVEAYPDYDNTVSEGAYQTVSLGGGVWLDSNGNGTWDDGESGLANVTVSLEDDFGDQAEDVNGNAIIAVQTDSDGNYSFGNLTPGDYEVLFSAPSGYAMDGTSANVTLPVTLTSGIDVDSANAPAYLTSQSAAVMGTVFDDLNANGVQDDGDSGLAGATVSLEDANGNQAVDLSGAEVANVTTDSSGQFAFGNLTPGVYTVAFSAPDGFWFDNTDAATDEVTATAPGLNATVNEGAYQSTLAGTVSIDNGTGNSTGEAGLGGVTVALEDAFGVAVDDSYGSPITTITDGDGNYSFTGLAAGDYSVAFSASSDYVYAENGLANWTSDSVSVGQAGNGTIDATVYEPVTLQGWMQDDNAAGMAVAGVKIDLSGPGGFTQLAYTDASGYYEIPNLAPGSYSALLTAPGVYLFGADDATTWTSSIAVASGDGTDDLSDDVDSPLPATIEGQVDDDAAGGVAGVTVTLDGPDGYARTAETDGYGNYEFSGLLAGNYTVTMTAPGDYLFDENGSSSWSADAQTVAAGDWDNLDTTLYQPASVYGLIVTSFGGLAGTTVTLSGPGNYTETQTTDATGAYSFDNLTPGNYTLAEALPSGFDFTAYESATTNLTLGSGENLDWGTTGAVPTSPPPPPLSPGSGNIVYGQVLDDDGDIGLAGVTVVLSDDSGTVATATTDADGYYSFVGLIASPDDCGYYHYYTVTMTTPTGYVFDEYDDDYGFVYSENMLTTGDEVDDTAYQEYAFGTVSDDGAGNGGLAGVGVTVTDATGANFTTETNADGVYQVQGIALGAYTVNVTAPAGYIFDQSGNATASNGGAAAGFYNNAANEQDFSAYHTANITIKVTDDGTGGGLSGVDVGLYMGPSDVTGSNGTVTFTGLAPGTYDIGATLPGNMAFDQTGFDDWDGYWNGSMGSIDLQPGENLSIDWSAYTPTTLAGTAMASIGDGNVPLAGVSVALLNSNGMPATDNYGGLFTAIETDANGTYSIPDLAPGNYTAEFVAPPGYLLTNGSDNDVPGYSQPLTIVSGNGTEVANVTAVLAEPRTISGEVYDDYDGSGTLQDYDDGVACATVKLINDSGNVLQTVATDSSGNYAFTNEPTGCYTIQVVAPDGYYLDGPSAANVTISNITISNTTADAFYSNVTLNIGAYQPTTAQGTVFEDLNVDGEQDEAENDEGEEVEEPGIEDATVELEDENGNAVLNSDGDPIEATTDGNGNFSFANISPGYYQVAFTAPSGYTMNGPAANVTQALTVYSGNGTDYANAPAYGNQPVTIDGNVFLDINGDYENDDDEGLGEVTISLTDAEGEAVTDRAGSTVANVTTTDDGNFSFGNLTPGNYTLNMTAPDGYLLENVDDSGNATGNTTYQTSIEAYPDTDNTIDEGAYQATSLGGEVFLDQNDDELLDDGENGLANVTVSLVDEYGDPAVDVNGNAIAAVETDAFGNYAFTNLAPGTYTVQFETDGDYVFANDQTTDEQDVPVTSGLGNLSINEAAYSIDQPSTVAGEVYLDLNNDDELDPGDPGLGNVTVTLLTADGSALATDAFGDTFSPIYTLSNGTFSFANVLPGTYSLEFTAPANYTMDGANSTIYDPLTVLPTGDDPLEVPAYQMTGNETVSGSVWTTTSASIQGAMVNNGSSSNGQIDSGINMTLEYLPEITVNLLDGTGTIVQFTTTKSNGSYSFTNLTSGNYTVQFMAPVGFGLDTGSTSITQVVHTPGLTAVADADLQFVNASETSNQLQDGAFATNILIPNDQINYWTNLLSQAGGPVGTVQYLPGSDLVRLILPNSDWNESAFENMIGLLALSSASQVAALAALYPGGIESTGPTPIQAQNDQILWVNKIGTTPTVQLIAANGNSATNLLIPIDQASWWMQQLSILGAQLEAVRYYQGSDYYRVIMPNTDLNNVSYERIAAALGLSNTSMAGSPSPLAVAMNALYSSGLSGQPPQAVNDVVLVHDFLNNNSVLDLQGSTQKTNVLVPRRQATSWTKLLSAPDATIGTISDPENPDLVRLTLPDTARNLTSFNRIQAALGLPGMAGTISDIMTALYMGSLVSKPSTGLQVKKDVILSIDSTSKRVTISSASLPRTISFMNTTTRLTTAYESYPLEQGFKIVTIYKDQRVVISPSGKYYYYSTRRTQGHMFDIINVVMTPLSPEDASIVQLRTATNPLLTGLPGPGLSAAGGPWGTGGLSSYRYAPGGYGPYGGEPVQVNGRKSIEAALNPERQGPISSGTFLPYSSIERLIEGANRALNYVGPELRQTLNKIITSLKDPVVQSVLGSMILLYAGGHYFGYGFVVDGIAAALLYAIGGTEAISGSYYFAKYIAKSLGAENESDLDQAGQALAKAVIQLASAGFAIKGGVALQKTSNTLAREADLAKILTAPKNVFRSEADLLKAKLGPARVSNPEEYASIMRQLKEAGVEIEFREGQLTYSPTKGEAGKIVLDPDASLGALRHEFQHFLDDKAAGFPGLGRYLADPAEFARLEVRAYMKEVELAKSLGHGELVPQILAQMKKRVAEILGK